METIHTWRTFFKENLLIKLVVQSTLRVVIFSLFDMAV
jgi:hypothetical protein